MTLGYYMGVNTGRRLTIFAIVAALTMLGGCRKSDPAQIGTTAPDFTVNDGRNSVQLSKLRGKPVLLNFWASWCPPCVEEVPALVELQKQVGDKVTIVAVSMDEDDSAYRSFTTKHMPGMFTVRDGDHHSSVLFGTYAYPETFLIDRDGKIQRKFIGAVEWTSPEMIDYFKKM